MLEISLLQIYDENRKNGAFLVKPTVQWMQKQNFQTKQWQGGELVESFYRGES